MALDLPPVQDKAPMTDDAGLPTSVWSSWFRQIREQVLGLRITTQTTAYTAALSDDVILCDATGGAITVTLPPSDSRTGKVFYIKKIDSSGNAVTIDGDASETIDGSATRALSSQYAAFILVSDGSNWLILGDR